jgi:competence protein ComEC
LIVPHHGSRTSSTQAFLEAVHPTYALVSMGYRNRYGHPHPLILGRYQAEGIPLLSTVGQGAIQVDLHPSHPPRLSGWRLQHRRYWHEIPLEPKPSLDGEIPRKYNRKASLELHD